MLAGQQPARLDGQAGRSAVTTQKTRGQAMRVASGVILIIAGVMNLFAALGYLAGGALVGGADKMTKMAEEQSRKQGRELTEEQKASFAQLNDASSKMKNVAGPLMGFGAFLFVTAGTSIAGAVCLFRRKAAKFIMVAGGLAIGAEVLSMVIVGAVLGMPIGFGKVIFSSLGLVGGILGILSARQLAAAMAEPAPAPPPVAAQM
jgi:hypothetical protein